MSSKDNIRVIIQQNAESKCVLTVERKEDGNVILALRTASFIDYNDITYSPNDEPQDVVNEKYSIHVSNNSHHQANLIKRETIVKESPSITGVQYTTAIKRDNGFAVVFSRRCPGMLHPVSDIKKPKPNRVYLGSYDPMFFSLIFMVLVSHKDRLFDSSECGLDINVTQFQANEFNIVVLWSYLSVPAYNKGTILHAESPKIDDITFQNGNASVPGINEIESFEAFRFNRQMLFDDLKNLLFSDPEFDRRFTFHLLNSVFFRNGRGKKDYEYVNSHSYRPTILNAPRLYDIALDSVSTVPT